MFTHHSMNTKVDVEAGIQTFLTLGFIFFHCCTPKEMAYTSNYLQC
jgi:hypothetical protein